MCRQPRAHVVEGRSAGDSATSRSPCGELDVTQLRHMLYVFQPAESDSHYADSEGDPGELTLPMSSCQIASATLALHCAYMACAVLSPPLPTAATLRSVSAATCS
jgi:hypothetical protein